MVYERYIHERINVIMLTGVGFPSRIESTLLKVLSSSNGIIPASAKAPYSPGQA